MDFIDLFCGIGGIRLGLEGAGCNCVFSSEIDNSARETYRINFGEEPHGDICNIEAKDIPEYDILCAGFPCQPFSICGHQKGFEDTRGAIFLHICKIIQKTSPHTILLENVKNLIHHDNGNTLKIIINSLENLGYKVAYKTLNAKDFNVPQNRERIIIIANKKKYFDFSLLKNYKQRKLKDFLTDNEQFDFLKESEFTILDKQTIQKSGLIFAGYRNKNIWKKKTRPNTEHLSRVHRQPNRIYSIEGTHPTIPSQETSGRFFIYNPENKTVRKLTIKECYKIMGFPNNFKINPVKTEAYKQIGNSVCVPLIKEIGFELINQGFFETKYQVTLEG